jgi:hypothetical protein
MRGVIFFCVFVCGCGVELGVCDEESARVVVYDEEGLPAYAGQALVQVSCGDGAHCHGAEAMGRDRFGAPLGLDFDMHRVEGDDEEGLARLEAGRGNVTSRARTVFHVVERGDMPPWGEATAEIHVDTPRYRFVDGEGSRRLDYIDSFEGLEILKNWLACGAPVVERTDGPSRGVGDSIPMLSP